MSWLQPWAWLGLGALVVPVLVHLLSKRPARTEAFPSLRFLVQSPLRPTRRTRISDWPLLLVRLAVLLCAVIALAQPTRRAAAVAGDGVGSRIRLVDTLTVEPATPRADSSESMQAALLTDGVRPAVARLQALPAPRTLEVVSTFADGVVDSSVFSTVPRDVSLSLTVASPRNSTARRDTIAWQTPLNDAQRAEVLRAMSALSGAPVRIEPSTGALATEQAHRTHTGGSAGRAQVLHRVAGDEALRALAANAPAAPTASALDSTLTLVRDASGRSRVWAIAIGDSLVLSSNLNSVDASIALLLAAGGTVMPAPRGVSRDSATLARWAKLPSGEAIGDGLVQSDLHRVATDARWVWLVVLLLLTVEWQMRRVRRSGGAT